jgi:AraC-like DNA-binding protein
MEYVRRTFKKEIMQQILDCFVELTGIRASYIDNFEELVRGKGKDFCKFCSLLRTYPAFESGCIKSDKNAFHKAEQDKRLYLYQCHMGLWEAIIPIYVYGHSAGFLMLGQIRCSDEENRQLGELAGKLSSIDITTEAMDSIKAEYINMLSLSREKIEATVKMFDIIAHHLISAEVVSIHDLETVEKIRKIIHDRFKESISTSYIAKQVCMSESYVSYLFKKETGDTITEYIEKTRLKKAKELLDLTSLSVKEISSEIGYQDQNYFSRMFKKHEGISPTRYRCETRL